MNRRVRELFLSVAALLCAMLTSGCDLKEALCIFLGDSCSDVRPNADPAQFGPPPPPAAVEAVFLTPPPSSILAGEPWPDVVVELRNQFGERTDNEERITVELVHNGSGAFLGGFTGFTSNGRITLSDVVYRVAEQINVTVMAEDLSAPASVAVTVMPAAADAIRLDQAPLSDVAAGATWPDIVVHLEDEYGNRALNDVVLIVDVTTGSDILNGTTMMSTVAGIGTFSGLSYNTVELVSVAVSADGGGLSTVSAMVNVIHAPAAGIAFHIPPGEVVQIDEVWSLFAVEVVDMFGNRVVDGPSRDITLTHSGSGNLIAISGGLVRSTLDGRVAFDDLQYDQLETLDITLITPGFAPLMFSGISVEASPPGDLSPRTVSLDTDDQEIRVLAPQISADSRYITYAEIGAELIFQYDLVTGTVRRLASGNGSFATSSHDGNSLAVFRCCDDGDTGVFFHRINAPTVIPIGALSSRPTISDNGRYIGYFKPYRPYVFDVVTGVSLEMSVNAAGEPADFDPALSVDPKISGDGRHVVFLSAGTNLVPGDVNGAIDSFVHDRDVSRNGVFDESGDINTVRVNVSTDGTVSNFPPDGSGNISRDGRFVVFATLATNLDPRDPLIIEPDGERVDTDIYVRDRDVSGNGVFDEVADVVTTLVSLNSLGEKAKTIHRGDLSAGYDPKVSDDGRFVVFLSTALNLDQRYVFTEAPPLLPYLHDRDVSNDGIFDEPGDIATVLLFLDDEGGAPLFTDADYVEISGDGRYVLHKRAGLDRRAILAPNPLLAGLPAVQVNNGTNVDITTTQSETAGSCDFSNEGIYVTVALLPSGTDASGLVFVADDPSALDIAPLNLGEIPDSRIIVTPRSLETTEPIEHSHDIMAGWGADPMLLLGGRGSDEFGSYSGFDTGAAGVSYLYIRRELQLDAGESADVTYTFIPPIPQGGTFDINWHFECQMTPL